MNQLKWILRNKMPSGVYQRTEYHKKRCCFQKGHGRIRSLESYRNPEYRAKLRKSFNPSSLKGLTFRIPIGTIAWNKDKIGWTNSGSFQFGKKHPNWKGGIQVKMWGLRHSKEYKKWRRLVKKRDDYTCVNCGEKNIILYAHHIKPFSSFPKLRLKIENGITLCEKCHF